MFGAIHFLLRIRGCPNRHRAALVSSMRCSFASSKTSPLSVSSVKLGYRRLGLYPVAPPACTSPSSAHPGERQALSRPRACRPSLPSEPNFGCKLCSASYLPDRDCRSACCLGAGQIVDIDQSHLHFLAPTNPSCLHGSILVASCCVLLLARSTQLLRIHLQS